jgi:cell division transport system ATP-binding protein
MPNELSGGEQQRIVIGRALLNSPEIILADEPTGNLDSESGNKIVQLLHDICDRGTAVIMTTHNYQLVQNFPAKVKKCEDGQFFDYEL